MIPRDEFSTIVAGSVTADEFLLVDTTGATRYAFRSNATPVAGYGIEYEDPVWVIPETEAGLNNYGATFIGPISDLAASTIYARTRDSSVDVRAEVITSVIGANATVQMSAVGVFDSPYFSMSTDVIAPFSTVQMSAERLLIGGTTSTMILTADSFGSFIPLPYTANWADFGGGQNPGGYRRIGDIVYLTGLVRNIAATAGPVTIATLPPGCTPLVWNRFYNVPTGAGINRLDVNLDGTIVIVPALAAGSLVALNAVFFSVNG